MRMCSRFSAVLALGALVVGALSLPCNAGAEPPPPGGANDAPDAGALVPLKGEWMESLELPGGGIAYVAPPVGSTGPRPVIVAAHGAYDDPGLICSAWRLIADVYPFVVCPGGTRVGKNAYVWPTSEAISKGADLALAAARAKYGDRMQAGPAVYVAFSQGANMAGPVLGPLNRHEGATRFARAVLTEGGYRAFEAPGAASAVQRAGGQRVLYTCSQPGCAGGFAGSKGALGRVGVDARVVYSGAHGHSMPPAVRSSIHTELPWVVEGLAGWEGYAAHPRLPGN